MRKEHVGVQILPPVFRGDYTLRSSVGRKKLLNFEGIGAPDLAGVFFKINYPAKLFLKHII